MYEPTIVHFAEVAREKADAAAATPVGFFVASMMGGAYIGIAMILALSVAAGLDPGVRPLAMGAVFGVGLILCVFAGAELFTGYVMYVGFGLARRTLSCADAARLFLLVWVGNLVGALLLSWVFVLGGGGAIFGAKGGFLQAYTAHKVDADATALVARAALCNWLVCLAIWVASRVQGDTAKCLVLAWVLMAFVAAGFEHSVANMTALALGLLIQNPSISIDGVIRNVGIVTVGNIIGAAVFLVGGYLAVARTDVPGLPRHDTGLLPTALRTPTAAE